MTRMKKIVYVIVALLIMSVTACKTRYFTGSDKKIVNKVVDWQMQRVSDSVAPINGWVYAALFRGMAEWAGVTDSKTIYDYLYKVGEKHSWDMLPRVYDADDLAIGQTYFKLYDKYGEEKMIKKVAERVDYIIGHPDTAPLITEKGKYYRGRWGWCDALFMAPPVYARLYQKTGNVKYLDFCFAEYKVTTDSLFDKSASLFFRDLSLVDSTNSKGENVFWGRGNGWVYAGLPFLLNTVPKSHPSYNYYLNLYQEMTKAIVACQDETGTWHSSLLEKEAFPQPENSASGFFVYGLAWGVNNGILNDPASRTAAIKGWHSLQKYVDANGKLGFVQPIGHAPIMVKQETSAPYGVGAYLLAAAEMSRLNKK